MMTQFIPRHYILIPALVLLLLPVGCSDDEDPVAPGDLGDARRR